MSQFLRPQSSFLVSVGRNYGLGCLKTRSGFACI
jgi:hypothetical protein